MKIEGYHIILGHVRLLNGLKFAIAEYAGKSLALYKREASILSSSS